MWDPMNPGLRARRPMLRTSAVPSPISRTLLASATVLASLALARPAASQTPAVDASDACGEASGRHIFAPSGASLLVLASCHEQRGRTASAWAEYLEAATMAHREKRFDVEAAAKSQAASLEKHLSTLAVRVAPGADIPGLDVRRDGIVLGRATWGTAAPVDPGEHRIEATAPGRLPWRRTIVVRPGEGAQSVDVGPLEDSSTAVATTTLTSATMPRDDARGSVPDRSQAPASTGSTQRTLGLAAAGAGLVGLGLGTYFGIRTFDQSDAARRACPTSPCSDRAALETNDQAKTSAVVSTVSLAAGGGLVLLGSLLFFTAPAAPPRASAGPVRARTFDVAATPAFTGVRMGGDF